MARVVHLGGGVASPSVISYTSVEPQATVGVDSTGDGRPNYFVTGVDRNFDGIPDSMQQNTSVFNPQATVGLDTTGDGRANYFVSGSDRNFDGFPDVLQQSGVMTLQQPPRFFNAQATVGIDTTGDGRPNYYLTGTDRNYDGIPDMLQQRPPVTAVTSPVSSNVVYTSASPRATVGIDTTGDGRPNYFYSGVDRNLDGIPDNLQRPAAPPTITRSISRVPSSPRLASGVIATQPPPPVTVSSNPGSPSVVYRTVDPQATVGVDTTGDGRPNVMLTGVDRNFDGIPDALQYGQGPPLLVSSVGVGQAVARPVSPTVSPISRRMVSPQPGVVLGVKRVSLQDDWDIVGYKLAAKVNDRYFDFFGPPAMEYELGKTMSEKARPHHAGGLYVFRTLEEALGQSTLNSRLHGLPRVVLLCACSGPFVQYRDGKAACTCLTPLLELDISPKRSGGVSPRSPRSPRPRSPKSPRSPRQKFLPNGEFVVSMLDTDSEEPWTVIGYIPPVQQSITTQLQYVLGETIRAGEVPNHPLNIFVSPQQVAKHVGSSTAFVMQCICSGPFFLSGDGLVTCTQLEPVLDWYLDAATGQCHRNWGV